MIVRKCDDRDVVDTCPFCRIDFRRWDYSMRCVHPQPASLKGALRGKVPPRDCPLRTQPETVALQQWNEGGYDD
jgi:hypothetical protein